MDEAMLDAGVTSWLATVMTTRRRDGGRPSSNMRQAVHLEGPLL